MSLKSRPEPPPPPPESPKPKSVPPMPRRAFLARMGTFVGWGIAGGAGAIATRQFLDRWGHPKSAPIVELPPINGLSRFQSKTIEVDRGGDIAREREIEVQYFTEEVNGIGIDMVAIPGGSFRMGSPEGEIGRNDNESPQHDVNVPPFCLGKFAVTQAQWQAVSQLPQVSRSVNADPSHFKGDNRPVETVSWNDAQEFCARLSAATGKDYRLPSEVEWEYACRAGTTTPFAFGKTLSTAMANYSGISYGDGREGVYRQQTVDVDSFWPNGWGLYNMHGNVYEWCQDTWHNSYNDAPNDGSAWVDNGVEFKLLRGGFWGRGPGFCRSASRNGTNPDRAYEYMGLRVAVLRAKT